MSRNQFISSSDMIHEEDEEEEMMREQLFEKPLTPSDVGKLNRLVIPKQHAEKYFPLGGDSILLSFEDESGKSWRFRYSYWNSSQSYVLTKGWSRFVKEKRLDAGDVVMFQRRRIDGELCISWKRRSTSITTTTTTTTTTTASVVHDRELSHQVVPNPSWTQAFYNAQFSSYPSHPPHQHHVPLLYQPACLHAVEPVMQTPMMTTTMPVNSKRLRLFGVNLDCQIDDSDLPPMSDSSSSASLLSQGRAQMAYSQGHGPDHNSYYYQY